MYCGNKDKLMDEDIKKNLKDRSSWLRGLFILLFVIFYNVAEIVLMTIVVVQFGFKVVTGEVNDKILGFSKSLSRYIYEVFQFITYESETMPFPFSDWPESDEPKA